MKHVVEGSQEDYTLNIIDESRFTKLSQDSGLYKKNTVAREQLTGRTDPYDVPSWSPDVMRGIMRKGAKTTMDMLASKPKTYGKVKRTKTSVPPSSSPQGMFSPPPPQETEKAKAAGDAPPLPAPVLAPARANITSKMQRDGGKEKAYEKLKSPQDYEEESFKALRAKAVAEEKKSLLKTYGNAKRSKTGLPSSSPRAVDGKERKGSVDDTDVRGGARKRKSDIPAEEETPFELLKAKSYARRKSTAAMDKEMMRGVGKGDGREVIDLSSSQVDPVDQISSTSVQATKTPTDGSGGGSIPVPRTTSQPSTTDKNTTGSIASTNSGDVSVVKVTKSARSSGSKLPPTISPNRRLSIFDSSQEQAAATQSVKAKVDAIMEQTSTQNLLDEVLDTVNAGENSQSSGLSVSFDKGLPTMPIVELYSLSNSQKGQYQEPPISTEAVDATLPDVMTQARRPSGGSATVANSTWQERRGSRARAPSVEPLSSQIQGSERKVKRSKTGVESVDLEAKRARRYSDVAREEIPSSSGESDVVARPSARKNKRSKTLGGVAAEGEPKRSQTRKMMGKTAVTYEKLKDPDTPAPLEDVDDTLVVFNWKKKSLLKNQETLDRELAMKLQEEFNSDASTPQPRRARRTTSNPHAHPLPHVSTNKNKTNVVDLDDDEETSGLEGLPSKEQYKPRPSARRAKSMSAKAVEADVPLFDREVNGLRELAKMKRRKNSRSVSMGQKRKEAAPVTLVNDTEGHEEKKLAFPDYAIPEMRLRLGPPVEHIQGKTSEEIVALIDAEEAEAEKFNAEYEGLQRTDTKRAQKLDADMCTAVTTGKRLREVLGMELGKLDAKFKAESGKSADAAMVKFHEEMDKVHAEVAAETRQMRGDGGMTDAEIEAAEKEDEEADRAQPEKVKAQTPVVVSAGNQGLVLGKLDYNKWEAAGPGASVDDPKFFMPEGSGKIADGGPVTKRGRGRVIADFDASDDELASTGIQGDTEPPKSQPKVEELKSLSARMREAATRKKSAPKLVVEDGTVVPIEATVPEQQVASAAADTMHTSFFGAPPARDTSQAVEEIVTGSQGKAKGKTERLKRKKSLAEDSTEHLSQSSEDWREKASTDTIFDSSLTPVVPFADEGKVVAKPRAPIPSLSTIVSQTSGPATAADDEEDEDLASTKRRRVSRPGKENLDSVINELPLGSQKAEVAAKPLTRAQKAAAARRSKSLGSALSAAVDVEALAAKGRGRKKAAPKAKKNGVAKSKEIVDADASDDETMADAMPMPAEEVLKLSQAADKEITPAPQPVPETPAAKPAAKPVARQKSISRKPSGGFKAPNIVRKSSDSTTADHPETPKAPHSTPPEQTDDGKEVKQADTPHSPLQKGSTPLRVGLSRKSRLPSLLKIIRK